MNDELELNIQYMDYFQRKIGETNDKLFPHATPKSICEHMKKELLVELLPMVEKLGTDEVNAEFLEKLAFECSDVGLLLLHLSHKLNISLAEYMYNKSEKNKKRQWGKPNDLGFVEHIREKDEE